MVSIKLIVHLIKLIYSNKHIILIVHYFNYFISNSATVLRADSDLNISNSVTVLRTDSDLKKY